MTIRFTSALLVAGCVGVLGLTSCTAHKLSLPGKTKVTTQADSLALAYRKKIAFFKQIT